MKLEIRNLQSSSSYEIDPEGAILGREGSKADIVLRDQAVSKKHAKIYEKNGRWYLEDLASSNGTFIDNRRISEPVILTPGAVFALSENQFEVVQVINGHNADDPGLDAETDGQDPRYQAGIDELPPLGMTPPEDSDPQAKRSPRPMGKNQAARPASPAQAGYDPADDGAEAAVQKGVGYFFIAIPKAIAYYLAAIPLMAVNPIGSIRKSVDEQRFGAMAWMELAAYAIPAMVFYSMLPLLVTIIVSIIGGGFSFGMIISGIITPAIMVVAGVIVGLIWHPVLKWMINADGGWVGKNILKGESDDKSRSNYFITSMTAQCLLAIPAAITVVLVLLARIPYVGPFIGILPPVIMLAASLVGFFVHYTWMKHFNVVAWFQKVMLVMGVVILAFGGLGIVTTTLATLKNLGSGGGGTIVASNSAAADAEKMAKELAKAGTLTAEQQEAIKKAQELAAKGNAAAASAAAAAEADAKKALKAAEAGGQDSQEAIKKAQAEAAARIAEAEAATAKAKKESDTALTAANAAVAGDKEKAKEAEKEEKVAKSAPPPSNAKKAGPTHEAEEDAAESPAAASASKSRPVSPAIAGTTAFTQFLARREACEKAINEDPALLRKADIRNAYEKYLKKTSEVRQKWAKKKKKDFATDKINDHLKDLDVFESTSKMVEELHEKIFR